MDLPDAAAGSVLRTANPGDRPETRVRHQDGDATEIPEIAAPRRNRLRIRRHPGVQARRAAILLGAGMFALLLYDSLAWFQSRPAPAKQRERAPATTKGATSIDLPPPNLLRPLSPEQAVQENAQRPFVKRPDTAAARFVLHAGADDRERAVTCLTQAIYYEAASEGSDGGRAVAQVILNRVRHPGYPANICGVVYQGSDRPTGCQFTFTCDGALLRSPIASLWARSRKIAEEALAGHVFAPIGHATYYHADYVLPYWADSLDKTVQVGRHIFYRLHGALGDSRSFFQRYAGTEPPIPQPGSAVLLPPSSATEALAATLINDSLNGASNVEKAAEPTSPLAVDSMRGTLVADQGAPVAAHRAKSSIDCPVTGDGKQLAPLTAVDMHSGAAGTGC